MKRRESFHYRIFSRPLFLAASSELLGIDRLVVVTIAEITVYIEVNREAHGLHRAIAEGHVKAVGVGAAKNQLAGIARCILKWVDRTALPSA